MPFGIKPFDDKSNGIIVSEIVMTNLNDFFLEYNGPNNSFDRRMMQGGLEGGQYLEKGMNGRGHRGLNHLMTNQMVLQNGSIQTPLMMQMREPLHNIDPNTGDSYLLQTMRSAYSGNMTLGRNENEVAIQENLHSEQVNTSHVIHHRQNHESMR